MITPDTLKELEYAEQDAWIRYREAKRIADDLCNEWTQAICAKNNAQKYLEIRAAVRAELAAEKEAE